MASLRKGGGMKGHHPHPPSPPGLPSPDSPGMSRKMRLSARNVLSAAIAEHYNRTHPLNDLGAPILDMADATEADVPWWVSHPLFKSLVVACLILGALSPVLLKVSKAESDQRRRRFHNDSFKKSNPEVAKLGEYEQNNYYCHAPFPGALDSVAYTAPQGSELRAIQIITRNGDRAPCGVLPFENNVTWDCAGPNVYDPSGTPIEMMRVRDEPSSLPSKLWNGNCWRCDLTGRGIVQQHMLGRALGDIYGERLEMSPSNLYVRSVDSDANRRGVRGIVRGLLTNAIDAGVVRVESGMSRKEDVLLPRLQACPRLAELWESMRSDPKWTAFKEKYRNMMDIMVDITSPAVPGDDTFSEGSVGFLEVEGGVASLDRRPRRNGGSVAGGKYTGVELPTEWGDKFDLFLDTVRARNCNDMALPCSPTNASSCVSTDQAEKLFSAGDWSFRHKYTFQREETAILYAGPLLALLLKNWGHFTGDAEPRGVGSEDDAHTAQHKESVQVYSGEVDTVGGILAALNVTDWAWPPYASNVVLELWKRTATETTPREKGGQIEAELFVRMLYNGRVVRPSFCQRDECPLRTYRSHVLQFLVPENLEVACRARHPSNSQYSTAVPTGDGAGA